MKKQIAEQTIAVELLRKEVENNILFLSDFTKINKAVKYDNKTINTNLQKDFNAYTSILQKIVDSYYFGYYEVSSYVNMTLDNLNYSVQKNLETLNSMKKLLKFVG